MTNTLYFGDNRHVLREHIADESVDLVYLDPPFNSNASYNKLFKAVVSVKAGENVGVAMIRDLRGAMERTGAEIGIFLTLTPPRGGMAAEAATAGQHEEPGFAPVPRIQIVTIETAMELRDRAAQIPARLGSVQKVAPKQKNDADQGKLL